MNRRLAFDIGIKNLAWCCADRDASGSKFEIRGWANENLITGGTAEEDAATNKCASCKNKATYEKGESLYCVKHCPPLTPALRDLSGALLKKLPSVALLKGLAAKHQGTKVDMKSKATLLSFLSKHYSFPMAGSTKVKKVELEEVHEGIRRVILRNRELFASCSEILLENQPAFKNPVMKSVQMMVFATLRDILQPGPPKVRLVHAGRKTAGATKGDEGYAERKGASEARVVAAFAGGVVRSATQDARWFGEQKKRSDLADALCMVLDAGV